MAKEQILAPEDVFELVKSYMNEEHVQFIVKAYEVAKEAHKEQFRSSGEPYIIHPVQVAGILAELQMDPAILHETAEPHSVRRPFSYGKPDKIIADRKTNLAR